MSAAEIALARVLAYLRLSGLAIDAEIQRQVLRLVEAALGACAELETKFRAESGAESDTEAEHRKLPALQAPELETLALETLQLETLTQQVVVQVLDQVHTVFALPTPQLPRSMPPLLRGSIGYDG